MSDTTSRRTAMGRQFTDTLRPLPHTMRWARFMADPPQDPGAGAPPAAPPAPPAAPTPDPTPDPDGEPLGEGGKKALQAERDARQQAEQAAKDLRAEFDAFKENLTKALGGDTGDPTPDPAQLTAQLGEKDTTIAALQAENAVLRLGAGIADVDLLLESRKFADSLTGLDLTDTKAVTAHLEQFVKDNPKYAATPGHVPGAGDAGAGRGHHQQSLATVPAGTPRLAAAFEQELAGRRN